MTIGLLGKKLGMTTIFKEDGRSVAVTVIQAGPCVVTQKKSLANDGYASVQLGFDDKPERVANKAERGHYSKSKTAPKRVLKEVRLDPTQVDQLELGQEINVGIFKPGLVVDVTGVTKGKGFQGVMKRHRMAGFPDSHGTHEFFRHGGSIGNRATPSKTFKNKGMPGHMGNDVTTIQNITVEGVDEGKNLLLLQGTVPGGANAYLYIREGIKVPASKRQVKLPTKATTEAEASQPQASA